MEKPTNRILKRDGSTPSPTPTVSRPSSSMELPDENPLISSEAIKWLNYRIQQEELSSRIYLAMSMWLNNEGFMGAACLWRKYSNEEMSHADWARTYLLSFGIQPLTPMLEQPSQDFKGLPQIIELSFEHEIAISKQIKDTAGKAFQSGDHMLYELTLRYLKEQVEEHDKTQTWMDKLQAFGTDKIALRLLDNDMAEVCG